MSTSRIIQSFNICEMNQQVLYKPSYVVVVGVLPKCQNLVENFSRLLSKLLIRDDRGLPSRAPAPEILDTVKIEPRRCKYGSKVEEYIYPENSLLEKMSVSQYPVSILFILTEEESRALT